MKPVILLTSLLLFPYPSSPATPSVDDLIALKRVGSPAISPDGRLVAYTVRETNWDDDSYETEIWLADAVAGTTRQLTNGRKSSQAPAWSPDGRRLAFISDRADKRQVFVLDVAGGEAQKLTDVEDGVTAFMWSPDGGRIAYTSTDPKSGAMKDREKRYGDFEVIDREQRMAQLAIIDVSSKETKPLTHGAFVVGSFAWSPDGTRIAFDHRINSDPANGGTADISIVRVSDGVVTGVVSQDGPDSNPTWSPDGSRIAFATSMANPSFFYTNRLIAVVPAEGGAVTSFSGNFDEDANLIEWKSSGIYFSAAQRTWAYLFRLDPATRQVVKITPDDQWIGSGFSLSADGGKTAFIGANPASFPEIYVADTGVPQPKKLTDLGSQTAGWAQGPIEVVSWPSRDGARIEGVLHKPAGFQPGTRYPLLVVIHGGPTGVSRPMPFSSTAIYPIDLWVARGALVLEPNYRGSAGYGEKFRALNVRNLGVGDAWDIVSGVDYLVQQGLADNDHVGVMGWSQGGYISAFLTTHDSARFKAVSVGAGISDWMTYYVNTDIHPFTRQYLKATPWDDPAIYAKTSPITYIKGAKAPTLIQHGATDQRVPLPNAFELYQGLQDQNVPVKLVVYRGFEGIGHGPSKPKSSRALVEHNFDWFDRYIWGNTATSP